MVLLAPKAVAGRLLLPLPLLLPLERAAAKDLKASPTTR
jgi:hypothetical protein